MLSVLQNLLPDAIRTLIVSFIVVILDNIGNWLSPLAASFAFELNDAFLILSKKFVNWRIVGTNILGYTTFIIYS